MHDLAAVRACITGPEPLYGQRRVALVLRVAGNRYPAFKLRPDLEGPILGHNHCDFLIAHQFSPLDAEMVLVGAGGRVCSGGGAGAAGWRREDGEITGQDHLLCQRAPLHPHPTSGVCKQQADGGEEPLNISAGSFETTLKCSASIETVFIFEPYCIITILKET